MVKVLNQNDKELYQCEECGFQYADDSTSLITGKEWAEKCEAWCREKGTCNVEITAHAISEGEEGNGDDLKEESVKSMTRFFYGLIGIASSLVFFFILYWFLRLDSSISQIIDNTYSTPLYFWPYVVLTFGAIILFGVNISLLVYRWRKFGSPKIKKQSGTGLGSLVGIVASACPVCGSTILSLLGVAGGIAVFPFAGLELKALSFAFLALPVFLIKKDLKKLENGECLPAEASAQAGEGGVCPIPQDPSFKESDKSWLLGLSILTIALVIFSWNFLQAEPIIAQALNQRNVASSGHNDLNNANISQKGNEFFDEALAKVLPESGFQSKISLGDSVVKLTKEGVIDREKLLDIYQGRGGLPGELKDVLDKPDLKPILLTRENANYYINLLWPLGLANFMESNSRSPILGDSLFNFASTGGWTLGKEENGGAYFNKFKIVELTPVQEALVEKIAQNTYRPCCNNSTFFQDCNHGSALLGVLQLGAAQGLTEDELYKEALAFNSFWFADTYIQTAIYFKAAKNTDWENVDPKVVLGKEYSSGSGFYQNVAAQLQKLGLTPQQEGGAGCGV